MRHAQRDMRLANGWFNCRELAQRLKVTVEVVTRLAKDFPPSIKIGVKGCWTEDDAKRMESHLQERRPINTPAIKLRADGYLSVVAAAEAAGIPHVTWQKAVEQGRCPRPTHRIGLKFYYTEYEVMKLSADFYGRKRPAHMVTCRHAAKLLGVSAETVCRYARKLQIGYNPYRSARWLSVADVERLRKLVRK